MNTKDEKRITVRVSSELYEQISAAATSRNLSVNAFIIQSLESTVNGELRKLLAQIQDRLNKIESVLTEEQLDSMIPN